MKKKITAVALVVALLAIAMIGGTLAYFTDDASANNVYTVGSVKIDLTETAWESTGKEDAPEVYAGEKLDKNPVVINEGANPCLVRIEVTGLDALKAHCDADAEDAAKLITLEGLDTTDWEYYEGYYYYKPVLEKGQSTSALFTGIRMPYTLENLADDVENNFGVVVSAQAVQAQGAKPSFKDVPGMTAAERAAWFTTCGMDEVVGG